MVVDSAGACSAEGSATGYTDSRDAENQLGATDAIWRRHPRWVKLTNALGG